MTGCQCPEATHVAGFRAWKRLGRHVRKGERGIRIMAPIVRRAVADDEHRDRVVAFKTVCVFDVSQTDGQPLPDLGRVTGDPGESLDRLKGLISDQGINLVCVDLPAGIDGWSSGGRIGVRRGLPPAEESAVLVHELAHELLHRDDREPERQKVRETEAEAVAFVVCEAIGLDTNRAAADYIQLYDGGRETLLSSLDRIQRTARVIIDGLAETEASASAAGEPLSLIAKRPAA